MLYQSKRISSLVRLMKIKMEREMEFQRRSFQLLGAIDALLTAATATHRHTPLPPFSISDSSCLDEDKKALGGLTIRVT